MATQQFKLDDGQGGWFRESRRHAEAAKKGMDGRDRHLPVNSPTKPVAKTAPKAKKPKVVPGSTITTYGGGQAVVLKVRNSRAYGPSYVYGYEPDGFTPMEMSGHSVVAVDGEWIVPEENKFRQLLERDGFCPTKLQTETLSLEPEAAPAVELPPLQDGEQYQVVQLDGAYINKGWARTGDPQKALSALKEAQDVLRLSGREAKFEIIPARSLDDAREIVRNRGKSDFLVTGDTYDNRHWLKEFGLKWDYNAQGYRGKLSPAQAEKVKARDGLSVESSTEYTYDEQRDSRIARAEAKADRYEGYAKNARERGDSRLDAADKRSERFEFGQPILVGHHSEKGARRDADRIWSDTKKGFEEHKKADDYEHRAKEVVAQASRRKGETEGHRNEVRQRNRSRVKEGTRIQHLIFGEGVVKKINTKTMKVEFDSKAGGGAKFSPNIDYADSFVVKDGGNQA
jgi:hypothetical protein